MHFVKCCVRLNDKTVVFDLQTVFQNRGLLVCGDL